VCFLPYLLSSAPSSPRPSKVVRSLPYLLSSASSSPAFPTLPPFKCAFEPSPHFFSSMPLSPWPSKVVHFLSYLHLSASSSPRFISFRVRLRTLDHQK
jgi:hypothetical protein